MFFTTVHHSLISLIFLLERPTMKTLNKIAVAVAMLSSAGAFAQSSEYNPYDNPSWYIAPSIDVMKPDSQFGVGDKTGYGGGLRFGKAIAPNWDIQLGGSYTRSSDNGAKYEQYMLGSDALYLLSRSRFRPFLLIGLGAERDRVSSGNANRSETSPYLNAGLGLQYSFTDQLAIQADLRRQMGFQRDQAFGPSHSYNNYLTAGLVYYFDKPASRLAARAAPEVAPMPIAVEPAPAVAPAPAPVPAPAPRFERITLSATELFAFDSATLRMPQPKIDEIADALGRNTQINNVGISGYTDRLGSDKYNQKLSQRRADAVKAYLVGKGVAASRLSSQGKGESNPVVQCSETKRAALIKCLEPNRRVEIDQITIEQRTR
jgi:OOP family OmpA-OmpF porin